MMGASARAIVVVAAGSMLACMGVAQADQFHVPQQFPTIQAAIDSADSGDEVILQPGVYAGAGNTNLNFAGRLLTLRSTDPSSPDVVAGCVIDCEFVNGAFLFENGETNAARVDGITIRNGAPNLLGTIRTRLQTDPMFTNCVIRGCAGLAIGPTQQGRITLIDCTIESNGTAAANTAAVNINYPLSGAVIRDCTFRDNIGGAINFGGGDYLIVEDCLFQDNQAGGAGGAIALFSSPALLEIHRCRFIGNSAGTNGGAVYYRPSFSELAVRNFDSCAFIDNAAAQHGGGLYIPTLNSTGDGVITSCTFLRNTAGESGGNIAVTSRTLTIRNCVLWAGSAPGGPEMYLGPGNAGGPITVPPATAVLEYTNLPDGAGQFLLAQGASLIIGAGVIHTDPLFVDEPAGDARLLADSPARDAGDPSTTVPTGAADFEGDPRIIGANIDLGADEYRNIADLNADGSVSVFDLFALLDAWGDCAQPCPPGDGCDADITNAAGDGTDCTVDVFDLFMMLANWG